ncbi:MAG: hypothetical protein K8F92_08690 [Hyphomicrobium sp.]|uniref:hypothetical protein n=1 Tax=Hyphomicrobium sp. TaxID=82 RepID=UPI0025BA1A15|nr:hypothetical protein [Hyphomicrobium sp.]MBZ0209719.1 hypothetical protein [Hyphomicrobium sp.]
MHSELYRAHQPAARSSRSGIVVIATAMSTFTSVTVITDGDITAIITVTTGTMVMAMVTAMVTVMATVMATGITECRVGGPN